MATDNESKVGFVTTVYGKPDGTMQIGEPSMQSHGIGDVNSTEKGTAARYNAGKWKAQYLPLSVFAEQFGLFHKGSYFGNVLPLSMLGVFQSMKHEDIDEQVHYLMAIYEELGDLFDVVKLECEVLDFGAKKYAAWNWAKGMPFSAVIASATRHLIALSTGEAADPESGIEHRGHVACNLRMLMFYLRCCPEMDDRPDPELFEAKRPQEPSA